jgi:ArsR family transcriptional regulator
MNDTETRHGHGQSPPPSGTVTAMRAMPRTADVNEAPCCDPVTTAGPVVELDDEQLAIMAKALGHPLRVRIVRLLVERQACMTGDLVAELPVAQSTVSEHLRILREAGLVQGEIEGPRTSYCVSPNGIAGFKHAIAAL